MNCYKPAPEKDGTAGQTAKLRIEPERGWFLDNEVAASVSQAILWLTTIPSENIRIAVHDGCVTLEGRLETWQQRLTLEEIVRHVPGVKAVTNLVGTGARPGHSTYP